MARAVRLFRGSELPRLLVLFAIVAVGWPLVWWKMRPVAHAVVPPVPIAAAKPLPPADTSLALSAIQDKTTPSFRENAAYSLLLTRVRETPAAELAAQARRDVPYTELWERPERYRGLPIHLNGTARRVLVHDELTLSPTTKIYEAYVYTLESQHNPYILVFEEPPPGLPGGLDIQERVSFDGYFLKLLAYQAGDRLRAAPMLVGRLAWTPPAADDFDGAVNSTLNWTMGGLSLLTLYALIRWGLHFRRMMKPARTPIRRTIVTPSDSIEPELLSEWLERAEAEPDEPEDDGKGEA